MKHLKSIYFINAIEGFASSLVGIFVPIFFLSLGYSLSQVLVYFIIQNIGTAIFFFLAGHISAKKSLRFIFLIRLPLLFLNYALLYTQSDYHWPIYLIGLVNAVQSAFFWFPLNTFFADHSAEKDLGKDIAKLLAIPSLICVFAPFLAGFITLVYGFKILFAITIVLYFVSVIPVFFIPEQQLSIKLDFKNFWKMIRKYPRFFMAVVMESIGGETEGVIWPIFVFLMLKSYVATGTVSTLVALGSTVFTYLIARNTNSLNNKRFLKIGALMVAAIWAARFYFTDPYIIFILSILAGFAVALVAIPFHYIIFSSAKKDNSAEFIIFREIPVAIGRTILYLFCLIFIAKLNLSFLLAAVSYLSLLLY